MTSGMAYPYSTLSSSPGGGLRAWAELCGGSDVGGRGVESAAADCLCRDSAVGRRRRYWRVYGFGLGADLFLPAADRLSATGRAELFLSAELLLSAAGRTVSQLLLSATVWLSAI